MNKKILWVDDDINSFALRAYVDEFTDEEIDIEKVDNPDNFQKALDEKGFDCLIMDMMMPSGENLSLEETKGGLHTGLRLLEQYLKKGSRKPIIIFSVLRDETVREWAIEQNVEYRLKQDLTPGSLYHFIKSILEKTDS